MGEKDETIVEGEKKSKGAKKAEKTEDDDGRGINTIVLKLDLHCDGCAKKVKRSIKNYNGVEEVKVDPAGGKLTVKGNVDANWLRNKVELKTKKKVELVVVASQSRSQSHPNNKEDAGAGGVTVGDKINPKSEKKKNKIVDDNIIEKMPQDQDNVKHNITQHKVKVPKKPDDNELIEKHDHNMPAPKQLQQSQSSTVVLKIPLHCDGCAQKIRRIIKKIDGVDNVTIDNDKNLVTMEGTMDVKELLPFLKQKLKRSVDIVSPNKDKDNAGGVPTSGGGEKKGKEIGGSGDKKEKAVGGGGDDRNEKATSGDKKEKKEKAVGGGDVVQRKEKLAADGGGEEKKKKKDGGGGLDEKDKAAGGGDKKDKENGGNKEKDLNTDDDGGGKKEKASGDGVGGGKKEKAGGEMKDKKDNDGKNQLNDSKAVSNDGGNRIKERIDEPKVEVNKMEYQRYDAPYTHYGVPMYNQNYSNQDYGLIHTMYNNPYHASTSYVTEYNNHQPEYNHHQPYNYQPYHHLHHIQQPQMPPYPPPTYLPPPQDHMFSDENPNACSTM